MEATKPEGFKEKPAGDIAPRPSEKTSLVPIKRSEENGGLI